MAVYLNENFDGVTAPALPSGWTGSGGTVETSTDKSYSGTNSLKISGISGNYGYAWNASALETNDRNIVVEAIFSPGSLSGSNYFWLYVGNVTSPSGNSPGSGGVSFSGSLNGESFWQIQNFDGGSRSTISGLSITPTFSTSVWYKVRFEVSEAMDCTYARLACYVQRLSDNLWLSSGGSWVDTGVAVPALVYLDTVTPYPSGREDGTFIALGCYLAGGQSLYWDSVTVSSHDGFVAGVDPASPPAAGSEVELIEDAFTAQAAGHASYPLADINGSSLIEGYRPNAPSENATWVQLDAGSGVSVTPTALHFIPTLAPGVAGGAEQGMVGAFIEGSTDSISWVKLGRLPTNCYPQPRFWNRYRLDPDNPGGTYRYIRLRATDYAAVSQFRILCENSGGVAWRPAPVSLSPAAGRFDSGQTVTMTCQTSGASIYYTIGTRASPPADPDNTDTLYSGPVTISDTSGATETVVKAVAYHASGDETYSRIVHGTYVVPARFVPDTGEVIADYLGNADGPGPGSDIDQTPQDEFDTDGVLLHQNSTCVLPPTSAGGYFYRIGQNFNTGDIISGGVFRGHSIYRSTDLFNWERCGFLPPVWPLKKAQDEDSQSFQTRPGVLRNPSASSADKTHVIWLHLGFSGGKAIVAHAESMETFGGGISGGWTYGEIQQPTEEGEDPETVGDCNVYYDEDDLDESGERGKAYFIFVSGITNEMTVWRFDQDDDWLSFVSTGAEVVFTTGGESPSLFKHDGYYYVVKSAGVPYGGGHSQLSYASATTLSGLASATETTIWEDFPGAGPPVIVPYNIQNSFVFQIPFRSGECFILCGDIMDPQGGVVGNQLTLYRARQGWYPMSAVAGGGAIDSFPNPGELVVPSPTSWDLSALPPVAPPFTDGEAEVQFVLLSSFVASKIRNCTFGSVIPFSCSSDGTKRTSGNEICEITFAANLAGRRHLGGVSSQQILFTGEYTGANKAGGICSPSLNYSVSPRGNGIFSGLVPPPTIPRLARDLVAYWPMDESSGNALDSHGTRPLTQNGSIASASGKVGGARETDADGEYFSVTSDSSLETGDVDWSAQVWVNFTSFSGERAILSKDNISGGTREWNLINTLSSVSFAIFNGFGNVGLVIASQSLSTGVWYHIVIRYIASTGELALFIDNVKTTNTATGEPAATSSPFAIGTIAGGTINSRAKFDEVAFWKRAITDDEVEELYNSGDGVNYDYVNEGVPGSTIEFGGTPSGGGIFQGGSSGSLLFGFSPLGGRIFPGVSSSSIVLTELSLGTLLAGGQAQNQIIFLSSPTGGVALGGIAPPALVILLNASEGNTEQHFGEWEANLLLQMVLTGNVVLGGNSPHLLHLNASQFASPFYNGLCGPQLSIVTSPSAGILSRGMATDLELFLTILASGEFPDEVLATLAQSLIITPSLGVTLLLGQIRH